MCTVTYIPADNGFYLTSNRDCSIAGGQNVAPREYDSGKNKLLYPNETDKNGKWIVAKSNGDAIALLNGAFTKHAKKTQYRKSQGLILMDIIKADYPEHYYKALDLDGIEPFTMVLSVSGKLFECRWDGGRKHIASLDKTRPYIWSSATLYDKIAIAKRNIWFNEWRKFRCAKTEEEILHFHRFGGNGDLMDGMVINRNEKLKTMSITNLCITSQVTISTYVDLKDNKQYKSLLPIESCIELNEIKTAKNGIQALSSEITFTKKENLISCKDYANLDTNRKRIYKLSDLL
jgi:hypothetical protein